ncbi:uncharacterized protein LOC110453407 isoform X2 [Mizuhopecten yessoensis]|uniref:uncharacterized protein LOC110453407 isoform X2 n=1 Tax=Mizuhopecten yessoensis TaxID=6573 RepID=UPI000B45D8D9|nr:uncharacterized protein LOC110453407 isoform X2 [Mizuhopecten yessoensis]
MDIYRPFLWPNMGQFPSPILALFFPVSELDITVNQQEMYFSLDATTVKFLPLHVEDLDIYGKCYKEFMQYRHAEIDASAIGSPWSHVLPSMKKGKVVGVTRTLPQNGPFKSYKDLKRHWKNTYGYRLPESEDGIIYYQVHFRPLGGRIFTYPEVCLRASDIQRVPRVDPKPILTAFLQGVQSKMSSICGIPLRLQTKAKYPILELLPPNLQMSKQANLSGRSSSGKIIYRSKDEMEVMLNRTHSASQSSQSTVQLIDNNHPRDSQSRVPVHQDDNDGIFQSRNELTHSEATMSSVPRSGSNHQREIISSTRDPANKVYRDTSQHTIGSEQSTRTSGGNSCTQPTPIPGSRIIPSFAAKKFNSQKSNHVNTFGSSATSTQITVPVFKPKKIGTVGSSVLPSSSISNGTAPNGKDLPTRPAIKVTCFTEEKPSHCQIDGSVLSETAIVPSVATSFKHKPVNSSKGSFMTGQTPQQSTVKYTPSLLSSSVRVPRTNTGSGTPLETPSTPQTPSFHIPSTPKVHQVTPKGTPTLSKKRPKQDEEGTPKIKKPRAKPQIQENLDVELFARANQLQKANAATLIAWLRDKGIQHKSKDKKSDLIDRVNTVLGLGMEP